MGKLRIATAAFALLAGASLMSGSASAMPINGQLPVATNTSAEIQQVRWVCGPYRCWWRPGPYYYPGPRWGYYGWHRPWGWRGGWGWHRGWRGHRHW
jgi:hypothetical protein